VPFCTYVKTIIIIIKIFYFEIFPVYHAYLVRMINYAFLFLCSGVAVFIIWYLFVLPCSVGTIRIRRGDLHYGSYLLRSRHLYSVLCSQVNGVLYTFRYIHPPHPAIEINIILRCVIGYAYNPTLSIQHDVIFTVFYAYGD
jgi:hypothetical protein